MTFSIIANLSTLVAVGALVWYLLRQRRADLDVDASAAPESEPEHDAPDT